NCPEGTNGKARWKCGANPVRWKTDRPDLSECTSHWVRSLRQKIENNAAALVNLASELAQKSRVKSMYGGDLLQAQTVVSFLLQRAESNLQESPDVHQKRY